MKMVILFSVLVLLLSCSLESPDRTIGPTIIAGPDSAPGVERLSRQNYGTEPSLFMWEGRPCYIATIGGHQTIRVLDFATDALISTVSVVFSFAGAFTAGPSAYIFGGGAGGCIYQINSNDLHTWAAPRLVLSPDAGHFDINPSVVRDGARYVMVYEEWHAGGNNLNSGYVRFAVSTDLLTWTKLDASFLGDHYAGGPTLLFNGGFYYLFYLVNGTRGYDFPSNDDPFYTQIARSSDLFTWEINQKAFVPISPKGTDDEGPNSSDLEMVEYNGAIWMIYYIGDQVTWGMTKKAVFHGTLTEYLKLFFD
jgi:hypothetical protein